MEATTPRTLHPALWVASIAATAFSLVGIASMTGVLPQKAEAPVQTAALTQQAPAATSAVPAAPAAPPVAATPTTTVNVQVAAPTPAPVAKATTTSHPVRRATPPPVPAVSGDEARDEGFRNLNNTPAQPTAAAPAICRDCGVVEAVNAIEQPGEANGVGAVIGGLLGGIVGNQIGNGGARQTARILGMAGGAYAGHQVEKNQRKSTKYELVVRFEDGTTRRFDYDSQPAWHTGERVKLVNGVLVANA